MKFRSRWLGLEFPMWLSMLSKQLVSMRNRGPIPGFAQWVKDLALQ